MAIFFPFLSVMKGAFSINISSVKTQCFKAGLVLTFHQVICKTYLKFMFKLISEFVLLTNSHLPMLSWNCNTVAEMILNFLGQRDLLGEPSVLPAERLVWLPSCFSYMVKNQRCGSSIRLLTKTLKHLLNVFRVQAHWEFWEIVFLSLIPRWLLCGPVLIPVWGARLLAVMLYLEV